MKRMLVGAVCSFAALVGSAGLARASEDDATRKMVKDEIAAYLKAEKENKEKEDKEKGTMKVAWKDGLSFESADKKFAAKLTGRIQVDYWTFPDADEAFEAAIGDSWDTGLFLRRARMGVELTFLRNTRAKIEYDFARGGSSAGFADVWVAMVDLDECGTPLPDVYAGHFREPFGLEELTSNKHVTFIERSLPSLAFNPARNTGLMLEKGLVPVAVGSCGQPECFDRLLLQAGVFHAFSNNFGDGIFSDDGADELAGDQDGWAVTGRAAFVPWFDACCPDCRISHLGVAASYRTDLRPDNLQFRARPEVGFGPRSVDTGPDIVADEVMLYGAEAAFVYDRFSAQGELMLAVVSAPTQGDPVYSGWYLQASYWLTGECRNYRRGKGIFDRVRPCLPLHCQDCRRVGSGAWELAARFSTIDLNDGALAVQGGEEWNVTVGLNWHLNNNVKVMLNYVHAEIDDRPTAAGVVDGSLDAVGVRVQAEW